MHERITTELTPEALAATIIELASDKKAIDLVELNVRDVLGYTDYFIVCTGNTERQVKAIHDGIHKGLKDDFGILPRRVEGLTESRWALMDYLDVIVHIFTPEAREFYRLDHLWGEVPKRAVEGEPDDDADPAGDADLEPDSVPNLLATPTVPRLGDSG